MTTRNLLLVSATLLALLVFIPPGVKAQGDQRCSIQGTVVDRNNARVADALVTVESTHLRRDVETNEEGSFQVELPPDDYKISVEKAGFKRFVLSSFRIEKASHHNVTVLLQIKPPAMPVKIQVK
jgi:hypothetical protein